MLEENKKLVREFFEKGNNEEKTPVDLCDPERFD